MGYLYETDKFVAMRPNYSNPSIFFDRFSFDFISLVGINCLKLDENDFEFII